MTGVLTAPGAGVAAGARPASSPRGPARGRPPLTVVTGPAGAGKTVLLTAFAAAHDVAWLSLSPRHTTPRPSPTRSATRWVPRPRTLVLDDVHHVRGPALDVIRRLLADEGEEFGSWSHRARTRISAWPASGSRSPAGGAGRRAGFTADEADLDDAPGRSRPPPLRGRAARRADRGLGGRSATGRDVGGPRTGPGSIPCRVRRRRPRDRRLPHRGGAALQSPRSASSCCGRASSTASAVGCGRAHRQGRRGADLSAARSTRAR